MQNINTNLRLDSVKRQPLLRKLLDLFKPSNRAAKFGYGLFGGTALLGTAVIVASATGGNGIMPDQQARQQTTNQAQPLTAPAVEAPILSQSQGSAGNDDNAGEGQQPNNQSNSRASVNINGENIELNENGEVHRTIKDGNSTTQVDISVDSSASNSSSSQTTIQSHSSSTGTSSVNINNRLEVNN